MSGAGMVIVGAGMSGPLLATSLRQRGYGGPIVMIGAEPVLPYHRPPLSKAFLKGDGDATSPAARPAEYYTERGIDLRIGTRVSAVDREARTVSLFDGEKIPYEHLVLATGARTRRLPVAHGALELRTLQDATAVRATLRPGARIIVIGGGFIGLELASSATERGAHITVVEALERVMARVVAPAVAAHLEAVARRAGVQVITGARVERLEATGVLLEDGRLLEADAVIVGIGVEPDTELAAAAGLEVDDGIVVDDRLRTSDPSISAIGDCARYPCALTGRSRRCESVQNATEQAIYLAARLTGDPGPYTAVPWFWSEQHGVRVQIAGGAGPDASSVLRGDPASGSFSVCRFEDGRLVGVESVDAVPEHMAARRLLAGGAANLITPELASDETRSLKDLAADLVPAAA